MVSCQPVIEEVWVQSHPSLCEICGGIISTGIGFSRSTSVFPYKYHSTCVYSSSLACCCYKKKRTMPGNLPKTTALSEIEQNWMDKGFPIVSHNVKLNNACSSTSTFLYVFMAWFLITWRILSFPL